MDNELKKWSGESKIVLPFFRHARTAYDQIGSDVDGRGSVQMESNAANIIELIHNAFRDVKRPNGSDVLHFPNTGGEIWAESFLDASEAYWWEVPPESIEKESSALTVLSPTAFRYYLPAYMTWVLKNYQKSYSNTVNHLLYDLDLRDVSDESRRIWEQRFSVLSKDQCEAVLQFLFFMSEIPDPKVNSTAAREAVESYWGQYRE